MNGDRAQTALDAARKLAAVDPIAAETALRRILGSNPRDPTVLRQLSLVLYRLDRSSEAIAAMRQAADLTPAARVFNDLGSLYFRAGDILAAIDSYRRAVELEPLYALGWANLADALGTAGRTAEAITCYRRVLEIGFETEDVLLGLAEVLSRTGNHSSALEICRRMLDANPTSGRGWHTLAIAERRSGDCERAIAAERRALEIDPKLATGWHALGNLLDDSDNAADAVVAYGRALELNPELAEARFDLAALGNGPTPPMMPREYTVKLFDDFAPTFELTLIGKLDYSAPEALRQAMLRHIAPPDQPIRNRVDILDLGCGTGLVGKQFKDCAHRLTGVDLSPGMLAQAEAAGVYDELACSDVIEFMAATHDRFDVVLAADLFIYIGDLSAVFHVANRVLRERGWFAFTVETIPDGRFALRRTRRYAHSREYLRDLASQAGFAFREATPIPLRKGGGSTVAGDVVVLRKLREPPARTIGSCPPQQSAIAEIPRP